MTSVFVTIKLIVFRKRSHAVMVKMITDQNKIKQV